MIDEILPYYNRELAFFRRMTGRFADENPKIAARLRLGPESSEDPHVERLIEAFAFLTARIRHKLDDDFPEITDALLNALYPHYLAPIPSMAIVRCDFDPAQVPPAGYTLSRGSEIETEPIDGEPCRFQTCYETTIWPLEVETAEFVSRPLPAPATRLSADAVAVVRLKLRCVAEETNCDQLEADSLRFFLRGLSHHVNPLYEILHNNVIEAAVAKDSKDENPVILPAGSIQPVGFGPDEGTLPYSARSPLTYRLLTEYFAFPEKFQFVEIANLQPALAKMDQPTFEIFLYLNRTSRDLERNVAAETFQLGCTPMVNLFEQRAEPINLTETVTQHRIVPDARRPMAMEVYSVDSVVATSPEGEDVEYDPFYSVRHAVPDADAGAFWFSVRQPNDSPEAEADDGTEVDVALVDLQNRPVSYLNWVLDVQTTCLNRDLPSRLPFGGGQPHLYLAGGEGPISKVVCLTAPTPTRRPPRREGAMWRLISHLSLGHLSLVGEEHGANALQEVLRLYDFADTGQSREMIDSILSVSSRRVAGRVTSEGRAGFCRGVEVQVEFRHESFSEKGTYLFARVLEHFIGMACSINSFTKLAVSVRGREGRVLQTAPRSGQRVLV